MGILNAKERHFIETISALVYCNPFLPERRDLEAKALGRQYTQTGLVWSYRADNSVHEENIEKLNKKTGALAKQIRAKLADGAALSGKERTLYIDLILYHLYVSHHKNFQDLVEACESPDASLKIPFYKQFSSDVDHFLSVIPGQKPAWLETNHIFACHFQVRRSFYYIFTCIIGGSMPTAKLRAAAWQSIFTHNMRRYMRCLYRSMGDINVLITGPSGTGKDLVAKAIGMGRYVPVDHATGTLTENFANSFNTLNISSLSPTLVESELFGHCKGSYTGAISDRVGYLEICSALGTIFLDEIGEIPPSIQVKLLHVFQSRTFQRLGDTTPRQFHGKIIAATNRDLMGEIKAGNFRADFYYRLCSDVIHTPSLREQLDDEPQELDNLIYLLVNKLIGSEECYEVTQEVVEVIETSLGKSYPWPGNVRELEQCVRNIIVRKSYKPESAGAPGDLKTLLEGGSLTADDLISYYCTLLYQKTENYQEVARMLNLDRRTVKSKVDPDILERFE